MSSNSFSYKRSRILNDGNYMLDLLTGIRLYVRDKLHDRGRKVRSYTLFFRLNGILRTNGLTKKKVKSISIKEIV
jgi:hypothetical protein